MTARRDLPLTFLSLLLSTHRKGLRGLQGRGGGRVQDLLPEPRRRHLPAGELREGREHPAARAGMSGEAEVSRRDEAAFTVQLRCRAMDLN